MSNYLNLTVITKITIISVTLLTCYYIIPKINHSMVFVPYSTTKTELDNIISEYDDKIEFVEFDSADGTKLSGLLMNYYKKPSFDDNIFLYSHGNSGWLGSMPWCNSIKLLSKFGSVFVYDYRQYGINKGKVTEEGCYLDVIGAWKYLTETKNVLPQNITIFGHSLGCAMSTKLVADLITKYQITDKNKLPKCMFLWAPFSSIKDMGNRLFPGLGLLTSIKMDNLENIQLINNLTNNSIPITILHSKEDLITPYEQSQKISTNTNAKLIDISGHHSHLKYDKKIIDMIDNILKDYN